MSLSKQLLLLISAVFLLIFALNFWLSLGNTRAYLQGEAQVHAQDTATSLGLSLSPYMHQPHDPIVKTMVSAIFDRGYYREIRLLDADNHQVLSLHNESAPADVPQWFIELLPITQVTASSEISSGWQLSGMVSVTVNSAFAYDKLFRQARISLIYSAAALGAAIVLLMLVLRITLASLQRLDRQALAIADGHFQPMPRLSWTKEVRHVGQSMNLMAQKIQATLDGLNQKLENLGTNLLHDDLTGLYKKTVFETDVLRLLDQRQPAFILLIKVDCLADLVKDRQPYAVDGLLQAIAGLLNDLSQRTEAPSAKAYRFYGGEFALLIESENSLQISDMAGQLSAGFAQLAVTQAIADLAHIGIAPLLAQDTPLSLLEAAHEAYLKARLIGPNGFHLHSRSHSARDVDDWKAMIADCIERANFSLQFRDPVIDCADGVVIMEEAFLQVRDQQGETVETAPLVAFAESFGNIVELDRKVIIKALQTIENSAFTHAVAVNLSGPSISDPRFRDWLEQLLKNRLAASRLVFACSAYAVAKHEPIHAEFFGQLKRWGGRCMIKRFESQSLATEDLKRLKPDFIRLSRDLSNGLSAAGGPREFVQTMQQLAGLLGFALLAENVSEDIDYRQLQAIGITGASR